MKVLMSAGKVEPHIAGRKADINLCIYPVEVQALLLSVFSVSVLPSDVVIPTASKRRPPRRCSTRPSPPLGLRAAAPRQRAAGGGTNGQQIRAAAGLNGMLRTRGSGRAAGGRPPQAAEG